MKKNIFMHNWITLLYSRNKHSIVNQRYFNKIQFKKWKPKLSEYSDPTEKMSILRYQSCLTSGSKKMQPTLLHFDTHKPTCSFTLEYNLKSQQDYLIDCQFYFLLKIIKSAFWFILQTFVNVCVTASEIALSVCTRPSCVWVYKTEDKILDHWFHYGAIILGPVLEE